MIEHTLQITLGRSMAIDVSLDEVLGVVMESVPPLPSSFHLTPTSLTGSLTYPINQEFTLIARNVKGEVNKTIQIVSDSCEPYTLRLLKGDGFMLVKLNNEVVHNSLVSKGFLVTVCTDEGILSLHTTCQSVQGCWIQLESGIMRELPHFIHYKEERDMLWSLPLEEFDVEPLITEVSTVIGWPIPTLLWSVSGFIRNTSISGLPDWISYDSLENSLNGVAQTPGIFEGSVVVAGYNESYSFSVVVEVMDRSQFNCNMTVISLVEANDLHSNILTLFSFNTTDLISSVIDISSLRTYSIVQVIFLPEGYLNFTFAPE